MCVQTEELILASVIGWSTTQIAHTEINEANKQSGVRRTILCSLSLSVHLSAEEMVQIPIKRGLVEVPGRGLRLRAVVLEEEGEAVQMRPPFVHRLQHMRTRRGGMG